MLMTMNLSREYTAILENAYDVSYEKIENEIGSIDANDNESKQRIYGYPRKCL
nr:MAG TPA: tail protein [Bacteriophage sp.]